MNRNWKLIIESVRTMLVKQGSSSHDADDLVQDALVKYATYAHKDDVVEPEAFLKRIARNLRRDARRISKRQGEQIEIEGLDLVDPSPALDEHVYNREYVKFVSDCLAELDDKTCRIFLAHRVYGLSYLDIARENGISVSAVEKQIAKAATQLTRAVRGW